MSNLILVIVFRPTMATVIKQSSVRTHGDLEHSLLSQRRATVKMAANVKTTAGTNACEPMSAVASKDSMNQLGEWKRIVGLNELWT